jgi:hypothetical protein
VARLDVLDVTSGHVHHLCELFLRQAALGPDLGDAAAELFHEAIGIDEPHLQRRARPRRR